MPKRSFPDEDNIAQPVKKQQTSETTHRKIRSQSSERSLKLLFEGAARFESQVEPKNTQLKVACSGCSKPLATIICGFCERDVCLECKNFCYKCSTDFCTACSFPTYDHKEAVCYSCCSY